MLDRAIYFGLGWAAGVLSVACLMVLIRVASRAM